jgi:hypothetical protein
MGLLVSKTAYSLLDFTMDLGAYGRVHELQNITRYRSNRSLRLVYG